MFSAEIEDLKMEILGVKRINIKLKSENTLLKVKLRKLDDEIIKKNKQIEYLINPRKTNNFRKLISDHGATLLVNLQEENQRLKNRVKEQDMLIRRLQKDIQSTKTYITDKTKSHSAKGFERITGRTFRQTSLKSETQLTNLSSGGSSRRNLSEDRIVGDIENEEIDKLYINLEKIRSSYIETEKKKSLELNPGTININDNNKCSAHDTDRRSPESDFDRIELQRETPHEEIQQLQCVFGEMIHEVKSLKNTLLDLKNEQKENTAAIENKDKTVEKLTEEIEMLKKSKSMNLKLINKKKYTHHVFNKNKPKSAISQTSRDNSRSKSIKSNVGSICSLSDIYGTVNTKRPKTRNLLKEKLPLNIPEKFTSKVEKGDFRSNKMKEYINDDSDHDSTNIEFTEEILGKPDYADLT